MSTRTALTIVGGVVGAYFGYPQLGLVIGGLIGGAVDPQQIQGPRIGELSVQTSQEGAPRTIVYGCIACYGNIIQAGPVVKVETSESQGKGGPEVTSESALQTFAVRICEGPIAAVLRVWADNKLVYDMRDGSAMIEESQKWIANKIFYLGGEDQLPDPTLVASVNADTPSYRGSAYMVASSEDITSRRSISQYRFEVAKEVTSTTGGVFTGPLMARSSYLGVTAEGYPFVLADQIGLTAGYEVDFPGSYTVRIYDKEFVNVIDTQTIGNAGSPGSHDAAFRIWPMAIDDQGNAVSYFGNVNRLSLIKLGVTSADYAPTAPVVANWWNPTTANATPQYGATMWFYGASVYVGTTMSTQNRVDKFSILGTGTTTPTASITGVDSNASVSFWVHMSREGKLRTIASDGVAKTYDDDLINLSTDTLPPTIAALFPHPQAIKGFGVDEEKDLAVYVYIPTGSTNRIQVYRHSTGELLSQNDVFPGSAANETRVVFTDENVYLQRDEQFYRMALPNTFAATTTILGLIVADIHERCGSSLFDVSELTDEVAGLSLSGDYTGASAIDTLRPVYFFDKSEHDKKIWYPKRGAAVIETLTVDDLTEVPDTTSREQAIEVPKKLHLRYQHADSGYAPVKATASASSPDMLTTGEASLEVPIVLNEDQAAQTVDKMYKVTRSEIRGTTEITVPLNIGAKYVAGNCLGVSLRGRLTRERIEEQEFQGLTVKLTLKPDRQSAYTSDLTGVPIPPPTLPPSTIVGETELAILDIPARVDSEDDLNYLVAVSGSLPPWYGARYQRSLDGGATYTNVLDISTASIMGELNNSVPSASEFVTDTTNTVNVTLFRDSQTLDGISNIQFLSEGGGFALEKADGSWEVMQYRDVEELSDGSFTLSTLHRGQLSSVPSSHTAGARFVMLQRPSHIPAQSAWIGQDLTHRAISFGNSADDTNNEETAEFVGRSQIEWPVASLELTRSGSDVDATWAPRHRFGTDINPVPALRFQGFRVTATDGSTTETIDTTTPSYSGTWASPVTITVASLNSITGAGPETSDTI